MPDPQWTVSIIAQYTEEDDFIRICYDQLIQSIQKHNNPNVKFYVLKYHKETEVTAFITYDLVSEDRDRVPHSTHPKSTKNFYDSPEIITEFFNELSLKSGAAHHFLITWGHGAGFGLFTEGSLPERLAEFINERHGDHFLDKDLKKKIQKALLFYNRLLSSGAVGKTPADEITRGFGKFLEANDIFFLNEEEMLRKLREYFRMITMQDLANAISESFGKAKMMVDFMYSMNCYMQMIESGYLLKENIRYFGSAENYQLFPGPDYDALFEDLGTVYAVPAPDLDQLSKSIIENHQTKYGRDDVRQLLLMRSRSMEQVDIDIAESFLSVNRLPLYEVLRAEIDRLARLLLNNASANRGLYIQIQRARKKCLEVTSNDYGIIDIAFFCEQLLMLDPPVEGLSDCLSSIITMIKTPGRLVVDKKDAIGLCDPLPPNPEPPPIRCPNGVSFFFPKDKNNSEDAEYVHYFMDHIYRQPYGSPPNIFLADSSWDEFVISYFSSDLPDD